MRQRSKECERELNAALLFIDNNHRRYNNNNIYNNNNNNNNLYTQFVREQRDFHGKWYNCAICFYFISNFIYNNQ